MTIINQATSWQDLPPLLTTAEVCYLLRIDERTLGKMVANDQIRRGKIGGFYKYPRQSVKSLAEALNADPFLGEL